MEEASYTSIHTLPFVRGRWVGSDGSGAGLESSGAGGRAKVWEGLKVIRWERAKACTVDTL